MLPSVSICKIKRVSANGDVLMCDYEIYYGRIESSSGPAEENPNPDVRKGGPYAPCGRICVPTTRENARKYYVGAMISIAVDVVADPADQAWDTKVITAALAGPRVTSEQMVEALREENHSLRADNQMTKLLRDNIEQAHSEIKSLHADNQQLRERLAKLT